MYYYNQCTTLSPVEIKIPTSQIIETIKFYKENNKSFKEFEDKLLSILN